jgi:predicted nucleic acid-binding protein
MFDASSSIYGWGNYPSAQFPRLWDWLGSQFSSQLVQISETAYNEVCARQPACGSWLKAQNVTIVGISESVLMEASNIKMLLSIAGDDYHPNGVGESDLLIIASAKVNGATLVSDESKQPNLPSLRKRYKIPAVCAFINSPVPCQNFLEYIRSSGQVF